MIVIGTHTVMDGLVIRWYRSEQAAMQGAEAISASRNGVMGGHGSKLTPDLFNQAWIVHQRLASGKRDKADFADLLTHQYKTMMGTEIEPIKFPETGTEITPPPVKHPSHGFLNDLTTDGSPNACSVVAQCRDGHPFWEGERRKGEFTEQRELAMADLFAHNKEAH